MSDFYSHDPEPWLSFDKSDRVSSDEYGYPDPTLRLRMPYYWEPRPEFGPWLPEPYIQRKWAQDKLSAQ